MTATTYIVPVSDYDPETREMIVTRGRPGWSTMAVIQRVAADLTPAQRKAARWPTKAELEAGLRGVRDEAAGTLALEPARSWQTATLAHPRGGMMTLKMMRDGGRLVHLCEGDAGLVRSFAQAIAAIAGPQLMYCYEDAAATAVVLPATKQRKKP